MNSPQQFRTAFNGFHREDVVNYISYISKKHETQLAELRAESEELRAHLAQVQKDAGHTAGLRDKLAALEQEKEQLAQSLESLRTETDSLLNDAAEKEAAAETARTALSEAREEIAALNAQLAQALAQTAEQKARLDALSQENQALKAAPLTDPAPADPSRTWSEELNAYRRAERTERRARERVNQMFDKANGTLAEASVRMEHAAADISTLTARIEEDLKLLHQAIAQSGTTMADTAVMLGAIRPELD